MVYCEMCPSLNIQPSCPFVFLFVFVFVFLPHQNRPRLLLQASDSQCRIPMQTAGQATAIRLRIWQWP